MCFINLLFFVFFEAKAGGQAKSKYTVTERTEVGFVDILCVVIHARARTPRQSCSETARAADSVQAKLKIMIQ